MLACKVEVKAINRSFEMTDERVTLTDLFDCTDGTEVVERFVTYVKPEIISNGEIRIGSCRLTCFGDASFKLNTEEGAEGTCYLLDFTLGGKEFKVVME